MRNKLVKWFIEEYSDLYASMCKTEHFKMNKPSNFHGEGSVWTHTMMVMTWIEAKYTTDSELYNILITSALLHDIAKCETQITHPKNKDTYSFHGHETLSTFRSVGILYRLSEIYPEIYSDRVIEKILKVISLHGVFYEYNQTDEISILINLFREADIYGAIRNVDELIYGDYPPRNLNRERSRPLENKEVIFMINFSDKDYLNKLYPGYKHLAEVSDKEYNRVVLYKDLYSFTSRKKMLNRYPFHKAKAVVIMTNKTEYSSDELKFIMPILPEGFTEIEVILDKE